MSQLFQKIKALYAKIRMKKKSYKIYGIRPAHDWRIFLVSTQIIVLILTIVAIYFYTQINQGKLFIVKGSKVKKEIKIDETLLKRVVKDIELRKQAFDEAKKKIAPTDPSL